MSGITHTRSIFARGLVASLLAALLSISFTLHAASISGLVTDEQTGLPVEGVSVCALRMAGGAPTCTDTAADGSYILEDLGDDGQVRISALETEIYARQQWPGISVGEPGVGELLDLAEGDRDGIDFALKLGFLITASVGAADDIAFSPLSVQFVRDLGTSRLFIGGISSPDGSIRSSRMVAGAYRLLINPGQPTNEPRRLLPQLYDGIPCINMACDPLIGTPIDLVDDDIDLGAITLQEGFVMSGDITEAASGDPVADGSVTVQILNASGLALTSTTVSEGGWTSPALPDGDYKVLFRSASVGGPYVDQLHDGINCGAFCDPASEGELLTIAGANLSVDAALRAGGSIGGEVLSAETGDAIEGRVELFTVDGDFVALTDIEADGQYLLSGLSAGSYLLYFSPAGASTGYLGQVYEGITCPALACQFTTLGTPISVELDQEVVIDAQLQRGATLQGNLSRADDGGAVSAGFVRLSTPTGDFVASRNPDAEGNYRFDAVVPGTYKLDVFPAGVDADLLRQLYEGIDCIGFCSPTSGDDLVLEAGVRTVDFVLNPGFRIFGRVFDAADDSIGIAAGSVDLYDAEGNSLGGFSLDGDGNYTSSPLPAGGYKLIFNPSGDFDRYLRQLYDGIVCEPFCDVTALGDVIELVDEDVEINAGLDRQSAVVGQVTRADDSSPLTSFFSVRALSLEGELVASTFPSASDGSYTLGLPDGQYRLWFQTFSDNDLLIDQLHDAQPCPGLACDQSIGEIVTIAGSDVTINASLELGGVVSGNVFANIDELPPVSQGFVRVVAVDGSLTVNRGLSADGSYRLAGLPPGDYYLMAQTFQSNPILVAQLYDGMDCPNLACDFADVGATPITITAGGSLEIDFVLNAVPMPEVSGRVLDASTGLPLAGVEVELLFQGSPFSSTAGITDADGEFAIKLPQPGNYAMVLAREGYITRLFDGFPMGTGANSWCPARRCFTFPGPQFTVDEGGVGDLVFTMDPGARVSGTALLPDGSPITAATNARIRAFDEQGEPTSSLGLALDFFNDTGEGAFATELPPGRWFLLFETNAPQLALVDTALGQHACPKGSCGMTGTQPVDIAQGENIDGLTLQFSQGVPITGSIFDADTGPGTAVEFATVYFYSPSNAYAGFAPMAPDGSFSSTSGFPPGTWFASTVFEFGGPPLSSLPPEFIDQLYDGWPCPNGCDYSAGTPIITTELAPDPISIGLSRGSSVSGSVSGMSGGLGGVRIELFDSPDRVVAQGFSNADGSWRIEGLLPGTYYAVTRNEIGLEDQLYQDAPCSPFCNPTSGTPIVVGAGVEVEGIDFLLIGAGSLSGTVTDEFDAPLQNVTIEVYNALGQLRRSVSTDSDGNWSAGNLSAGIFYVRTRNSLGLVNRAFDGFDCVGCNVTNTTPIALAQSEARGGIDLQLATGSSLGGVVRAADGGSPIAGVTVEVFNEAGALAGTGQTGSNGQWSVEGLAAGSYFLRTRSSVGFVDQRFDGDPCEPSCRPTLGTPIELALGSSVVVNFDLVRAGRVRGTVRDDENNPLPGIGVQAFDGPGTLVRETVTGSDGRYEIAGLPIGEVFLRTNAMSSFTDQVYSQNDCVPFCDLSGGTPLVITAGVQIKDIDFSLTPGGGLSGLIQDADGASLTALRVDVFNRLGELVATAQTDADGQYLVRGLADGRYFVRSWNTRGFVDQVYSEVSCTPAPCTLAAGTAIEVAGGIQTGIDFLLRPGSEIAGTATDPFGNPLPAGEVVLFDTEGRELRRAPINAGVWRLSGVADGTYFLVVLNGDGLVDQLFAGLPCPGGRCDVTAGTAIVVGQGDASMQSSAGMIRSSARAGDSPIDFVLEAGSRVRGQVTDSDGAAIPDAVITFFNDEGDAIGSATSDGAGRYESSSAFAAGTVFAATTSGEARGVGDGLVNALYEGLDCALQCDPTAGTPIVLNGQDDAETVDFSLAIGGGLTGRLLAGGEGLLGARVEAYDEQGRLAGTAIVSSLGNWRIDGLPDGDYTLLVRTDLIDGLEDFVIGSGSCSECDPSTGTAFSVSGGTDSPVGTIVVDAEDDIFGDRFEKGSS